MKYVSKDKRINQGVSMMKKIPASKEIFNLREKNTFERRGEKYRRISPRNREKLVLKFSGRK